MDLVSTTVSSWFISALFLTLKPQVITILRLPGSINTILKYPAGQSSFKSASRRRISQYGLSILCNPRPR